MPRPNRHDGPDVWQHVMNRGTTKRTIFETEEDVRFFQSLLAREVRAGRLEIHAYSLMLTHFHLLVRSVRGELSEAMRRIQNRYARYFNRTRKRDGPLFRGRFRSRWVDSLRYRRTVVGYIHDNAVSAGLVSRRADYEWSSAHAWRNGRPPRWLERSWIEAEVGWRRGNATWEEAMDAAFPSSIDDEYRAWVERQLRNRHDDAPEDGSLKHAASPRVVRWTIRKARLADGTRPWRPVCSAGLVERLIRDEAGRIGAILTRLFPRRLARALALLRAGLLRMLSGCSHHEIARRTERHCGTISRDIRDHRDRLAGIPAYEQLTARLARSMLAAIGV